jgi:hypothetical protein
MRWVDLGDEWRDFGFEFPYLGLLTIGDGQAHRSKTPVRLSIVLRRNIGGARENRLNLSEKL